MSADSVLSSKTNIFQNKLIYCRHFRTYSRRAMFDWSDTVFRRRNVTRRRISNTVLQPRYWGREANSPEVCRLQWERNITTGLFGLERNLFYKWLTVSIVFLSLLISTWVESNPRLNSCGLPTKYQYVTIFGWFMVFNVTFNTISAISWRNHVCVLFTLRSVHLLAEYFTEFLFNCFHYCSNYITGL